MSVKDTRAGLSAQEIRDKHKTHLFPNIANYYAEPIAMARGEGHHLYDVDGREYLDFFGGILTVSVGHCRPEVVAATQKQMATLGHTSTLYPLENQATLAERMGNLVPIERPGGAAPKSFFTNSGTEADETAVLSARLFTGAGEIIALRHGYSGRSQLAMSLTGQAPWRHSSPMSIGIRHAHNAYCYRCPFGLTYPSCEVRCARDAEELIRTETGGKVAALIAEPIQGVGGFITPPKEFFEILVGIVRKYGGIFICDEVQGGFWRTGKKFASIENWGVKPEIMTFAKGIANGMPMAATVARADVANAFTGLTISTFGGNAVSCAAAHATLDVMEKEDIGSRVAEVGAYFKDKLMALQEKHPLIGEVRGMGLMLALELVKDRKTKEPAPEEMGRVFEAAKKEGLLIGKGGLYGNVIRITPPMTVGRAEVDDAVARLDRAFASVKIG